MRLGKIIILFFWTFAGFTFPLKNLTARPAANDLGAIAFMALPPADSEAGPRPFLFSHGGMIRGDTTQRRLALIFTGGDYNDGGDHVRTVLRKKNIRASFFFTGDFYRNPDNDKLIHDLIADRNYLGPHSDKHLLYCSWEKRDSLLVTKKEFISDLLANYQAMQRFGLRRQEARYFIPPYEWYDKTIADWTKELGLVLVNFSPGTLANADYTVPSMANYRSSQEIFLSITGYEKGHLTGLNGFLLLLHVGTHPDRTDKFYFRLEELIDSLQKRNYAFSRIDELLQ